MASTLEQDIKRILEQTRDEIRANMESQRINASGRTSASIKVEEYDKGLRLVGGGQGAAPVPTLEFGREGGKVPRGFYGIIRQWARDKGLVFATERERNTFAHFVARKIAREGTRRHEQHADVYSTPVEDAKERIKTAASRWFTQQINVTVTSIRGAFTR